MRNGLIALAFASAPSLAVAEEGIETRVEVAGNAASEEKTQALQYNLNVVADQEILGYNIVVSVQENACGSKALEVGRHSVAYQNAVAPAGIEAQVENTQVMHQLPNDGSYYIVAEGTVTLATGTEVPVYSISDAFNVVVGKPKQEYSPKKKLFQFGRKRKFGDLLISGVEDTTSHSGFGFSGDLIESGKPDYSFGPSGNTVE